MRRPGHELGHFQPAQDVALGIVHRLAMLGAQQFGQRIHVAVDQRNEVEEHARAPLRVGRCPLRLRRRRRSDRSLEIGLGRQRDPRLDFAGCRVEHILEFGAVA